MNFDAAIFDMDGVLTNTATVHASAWKQTFDRYLSVRERRCGERFREFTAEDYLAFVDGRPRYRGVDAFLRSREIVLPFGDPNDAPGAETVCGLGNRKNELFIRILQTDGAEVYPSTVQLIRALSQKGIKVGVATSSRNCAPVLARVGIADLFDTQVDGIVSAELGLQGKPEPDIFTTACKNMGSTPPRTMIVEDAVSGVQAGAKGHFGLIVAVARGNNSSELRHNGADVVVGDLSELSVDDIDSYFNNGATKTKGISSRPL